MIISNDYRFFELLRLFFYVFTFSSILFIVIWTLLQHFYFSNIKDSDVLYLGFLTFIGVVFAATVLHRFLVLRSTEVYFDEDGVWVYSGVLPWERGSRGIKWRDFGGASFSGSFFSWLFKSYTIFLSHRYTGSEIKIIHCAHGVEVVTAINRKHRELIAAGLIPNLTQGDT